MNDDLIDKQDDGSKAERSLEKIIKNLGNKKSYNLFASFISMATVMASAILKDNKDFAGIKFPWDQHYAALQTYACLQTLHFALHNPAHLTNLKSLNMKPYDWQNDSEYEKRFIFVVKEYYEALKKEGKI